MHTQIRARSRGLFTTAAAALVALLLSIPTASVAENGTTLTEHLPGDSKLAAQIDVAELRESKYFEQAIDYLENNSNIDEEATSLFDGKGEIDIRSDVDTLGIGLPVAQVRRSTDVERGTLVASGSFEEEKIEELLREHYPDMETREVGEEVEAHSVEKSELAVLDSGLLVVAIGPKSYRDHVWKVAAGDGTSFDETAEEENLLSGLDTSRAVWMLSRVSKSMRASSDVETAGFSLNIATGLDLEVVSRAASESDAKGMVERIKAMKKTGAENPMLTMFGAAPLLENLSVNRSAATVTVDTSMSEKQLDALISKVRQFAASRSTYSIPSKSGSSQGSSKSDSSDSDESSTEESSE